MLIKIKTNKYAYKKYAEQLKFEKDRDEALASLSYTKISQFIRKHNLDFPEDGVRFWVSVHRARVHCKTLPVSMQNESMAWLHERGFEYLPNKITAPRIKGKIIGEGRIFSDQLDKQEKKEIIRNL